MGVPPKTPQRPTQHEAWHLVQVLAEQERKEAEQEALGPQGFPMGPRVPSKGSSKGPFQGVSSRYRTMQGSSGRRFFPKGPSTNVVGAYRQIESDL